ncbi:MAG: 3-dehydroquinate synthase [Bacteroidales bacterium]|nr:3-dehydroquinate synthase [Bacteroidales bacterium]
MILKVHSTRSDYDILIERGALGRIGAELGSGRRVLVVTDSGVPPQYAETVARQCAAGPVLTIPQGESHKSFESLQTILSVLLERGFTRKDAVVAVGGGVVGDLAGFAAACYMRGIDFYNVPTTLLAQVDSSVGGKTAVDFQGVKNIVGAFHDPRKVVIDPDVLQTLPPRLLHEGLVEAIKMAATCDAALFAKIEAAARLDDVLDEVIAGAVRIKADVVSQDPTERGLRRVLNFGHTVGHAVEAAAGGALYHGECVGIGMLPMAGAEARPRIRALLERYSLPVAADFGPDELMQYMIHDKKAGDGGITVVFVDRIGSFEFRTLDTELLRTLVSRA